MSDSETPHSDNPIPPRVQAAQAFLNFALRIREPALFSVSDVPLARNDLSPREQTTYEAALNVLLLYFRGEMDFGDVPSIRVKEDDDDPPKSRVPVAAG